MDGNRGGDAGLLLLTSSFRDSCVVSVSAGEFSNSRCSVAVDVFDAFAFDFPLVLKDGTFFIRLFIIKRFV